MRRFFSVVLTPLVLVAGLAVLAPGANAATTVTVPTVKGGFEQTPTISFTGITAKPPTKLQTIYLHRGTGSKVVAGQLLVVNYLAQIWKGKVFDSSFARGQLSGFPIGVGQVIPGWDTGLVGVPVGSEVELIVPPAQGYGPSGNTGAGITGTDTLVFVVDVVGAYGPKSVGDPNAKVERTSVNGITVTGKTNAAPTVKIAKNTKKPTSVSTYLIAQGHGAKITAGLLVVQLVEVEWNGTIAASTWKLDTPYGANLGVPGETGVFDKLIGMKLGSRVLIELPEESSQGPYAVVADAVAEPHDGAAK